MRPILFTISPLPHIYLPYLASFIALAALAGAGVGWMRARKQPEQETEGSFLSWLGVVFIVAIVSIGILFIWNQHPVRLHSYGLLLVLGFFVATWISCLEARRRGVDPNLILDLALPLLFVSILFCRLVYVALNPSQFQSAAEVVSVWDGGLSFHGAFIGAPLVLWYFARTRGITLGALCDIIAPSVFLGYAFGRVGCFMNGCCYGAACALPWAVRFPDEHNRLALTLPSHPAQLYSAAMAVLLFFVMQRARLLPRFNRFPGQLTLLFLFLYACERFIMEVFRNGATANPIFGLSWLTEAQFVSVLAVVIIAITWRVLLLRHKSEADGNISVPKRKDASLTVHDV